MALIQRTRSSLHRGTPFNLTASIAFAMKNPNRAARTGLRIGKDNWLVHENAESGKDSAADGVKINVD
jgi:hypothetical protein